MRDNSSSTGPGEVSFHGRQWLVLFLPNGANYIHLTTLASEMRIPSNSISYDSAIVALRIPTPIIIAGHDLKSF